MLYVRHQSEARGRRPSWTYDAARKIVTLVFERASVEIEVCSTLMPRAHAHALLRQDPCTWHIVPARYSGRAANGALITETIGFPGGIGVSTIALTDAPDSVHLDLVDLGR